MESSSELTTYGNLALVGSENRPNTDAFFQRWYEQTILLNGISVQSVAHEVCTTRILTGTAGGTSPDWATLLANGRASDFTLPHLVLAGPSLPAELGNVAARSGLSGQLNGLLLGSLVYDADDGYGIPDPVEERVIDRFVTRRNLGRAQGRPTNVDQRITEAYNQAWQRAASLKDLRYDMSFTPGGGLAGQGEVAIEVLKRGVSRCVSLSDFGAWDTHENNQEQTEAFESLFAGLDAILSQLSATPGTAEPSLLDETIVVVLSEMGRTPKYNVTNGRDHWPYTSALLLGNALAANRVIGGYDNYYYGRNIDTATADLNSAGTVVSTATLGATLMAMADIDPEERLPGVAPIEGLLR